MSSGLFVFSALHRSRPYDKDPALRTVFARRGGHVIRFIFSFAVVLGLAAVPSVSHAQSPQDIAKAKKVFGEGKKLHEKGKFIEAAAKFKEAYELSKNPLLLYNVALSFDQAGMEDIALANYRRFLKEAPEDAAPRPTVTERVKELEVKLGLGTGGGTSGGGTSGGGTTDTGPKEPVKIKPAGTYSATDFQHQVVDVAPPGKPLDVTAFVPEDSGFTVTLFFRAAGEGKWTAREMKWRYKELVGRIPAAKMSGDSVQYYVEVKDQGGNVVTRSGKSTSPNLVTVEAGAPERFYPDVTDEGEQLSATDIRRMDEEDDPLGGRKTTTQPDETNDVVIQPQPEGPPGQGFRDVGSTKFTYAKWGTTATAGVLIGLSVFSFIQAGNYASALEEDAAGNGEAPQVFDEYAAGLESTGKRYQSIANVSLGVGIGVAAVASYFWFKELTAKKRGEVKVSKTSPSPEMSWVVAPAVGEGFAGAAALTRF